VLRWPLDVHAESQGVQSLRRWVELRGAGMDEGRTHSMAFIAQRPRRWPW
jgi:hypothetical protein